MSATQPVRILLPRDYLPFLETIGESPETIVMHYMIRANLATIFCVGTAEDFSAAVVQWQGQPREPMGFGTSGTDIWRILQTMSGWEAINVPLTVAATLATSMTEDDDTSIDSVRHYEDIYYTLQKSALAPNRTIDGVTVRLLTSADAPLMQAAPRELRPANGFLGIEEALDMNIIVGAIAGDTLVAIAQEVAQSPSFIEVGVYTAPDYRQRGISTQATYVVCQQIQALGKVPVWSTGEDNWGSQNVAQKIGFEEVSRRVYLIPEDR